MNEFIEKNYVLEGDNPRKIRAMNREGLYQLFAKLGYKTGCEIGLEKGKNAVTMYNNIPGLKLYGVDSYRQHPQASYIYHAEIRHWNQDYLNRIKAQAEGRMKGRNFVLLEDFSEDATKKVEDNSLDFVYIDADHSYDMVMQDIIVWGRKIRKGGIVSGHDYYYNKDKPGRRAKVTQAVNDYTKIHDIKFFITNEDHSHNRKLGDFYPSWFWFKQEDIWPNVVGF